MPTLIKLMLTLSVVLASSGVMAQMLDRIAVVVNDAVITELDVKQRLAQIRFQYRANPQVLPSDAVLQKQVIDAMVLESLQLQMAERGNLVISDRDINEALQRIAANQRMTPEQLMAAVQQSGQTVAEFREQVRRELTINRLQQQVVGRQIFVSDAEVERYLQSQSGQTLQETQYRLAYKRFDITQRAEAEALAADLSTEKSLLDESDSRDLGLRSLADIPTLFKTLVPVLAEGEAIVLEQGDALHLGQLVESTQADTVNIEEYRIRHILIKTNALIDRGTAKQLLLELKARIEAGEDMAALADEFSEDDGSRGKGGDLNWQRLESFVPEFAEQARKTPVNEISDIVESPYGFHILRVEDKRTRDVSLDVVRQQVRQQLYQSRYNESLQRWLTELRAESFVEVRL